MEVNIPAFRLQAIADGQVKLDMAVIVGQASKQTPQLSSKFAQVVINPTWTIPVKIIRTEMAGRDAGYFARHGIGVYDNENGGARVDASSVSAGALRSGRYSLRQNPGPQNALGFVKFLFPNNYSVYLHDTPTRGKFSQADRDLSHGCVRVAKPWDLGRFPDGWHAGIGPKRGAKRRWPAGPRAISTSLNPPKSILSMKRFGWMSMAMRNSEMMFTGVTLNLLPL